MQYTEKQLLAEARLKFPVGTKVCNENLGCGCIFMVEEDHYAFGTDSINKGQILVHKSNRYTVWKNGVWAEVMSLPWGYEIPKEEIINKYQIY